MKFSFYYLLVTIFFPCISLAGNLETIKWSTNGRVTQVTIELSQKENFKVYSLSSPERIIVDIENVTIANKTLHKKSKDGKYINYVKINNKNNHLRITFDLREHPTTKKAHLINRSNNSDKFTILLTLDFQDSEDDKEPINKQIINQLTELKSAHKIEENKELKHGNPSLITTKQKTEHKEHYQEKVIVIDPGHGGNDSGTTGRLYNTPEKVITLSYALELKKLLEKRGYKVILTRDSDKSISLDQRQNIANKNKADIFVSLHADSTSDPEIRGASVYTLSEQAYDLESKKLSEKENQEVILSDANIQTDNKNIANLLVDLIRRDTKNISAELAEKVATELKKEIIMLKTAHRFAGFKVLRGFDTPAILIELGYLSNQTEERLLNSNLYKMKVVKAIAIAINKHLNQHSS